MFLFAVTAVTPLVAPISVYAQEESPGRCDIQLLEVCEEVPPEETEGQTPEAPIKGTPNPETVAGNEEITTPPAVLGAHTEVLAETGMNTIATVVSGVLIIFTVFSLQKRVSQAYSIRK